MKTLTEEVAGTRMQIEMEDPADAQSADNTLAAMYQRANLRALSSTSRSAHFGVPLSPEDLAVWRWRYPTVYRWPGLTQQRDALGRQLVLDWETLLWPVPAHVCGLIQHCFERARFFDTLEIWTLELRQAPRLGPSPILVGWIGPRAYLLARWAEALEPFSAIRAQAESRRGRVALRLRERYMFDHVGPYCAGATILAMLGVIPALLLVIDGLWWAGLLGGGFYGGAALLLAKVPWRWRMRRVAAWAGWVLPEIEVGVLR